MTILHEVSKAMNFTYVLNEPQTGSRFGGVISDLKAQVADIGVCHLFQQYNRIVLLNLDHSSAINMDHYSFLVSFYIYYFRCI